MSGHIPLYIYPSGAKLTIPEGANVVYKWADTVGGGPLPGPLSIGSLLPGGKGRAHSGCVTSKKGIYTVEYHNPGPIPQPRPPPNCFEAQQYRF